jgi:hypothetical protein
MRFDNPERFDRPELTAEGLTVERVMGNVEPLILTRASTELSRMSWDTMFPSYPKVLPLLD